MEAKFSKILDRYLQRVSEPLHFISFGVETYGRAVVAVAFPMSSRTTADEIISYFNQHGWDKTAAQYPAYVKEDRIIMSTRGFSYQITGAELDMDFYLTFTDGSNYVYHHCPRLNQRPLALRPDISHTIGENIRRLLETHISREDLHQYLMCRVEPPAEPQGTPITDAE